MNEEAHSHWKELARITGWRLGAYDGLNAAAFYTPGEVEVIINPYTGNIIRQLSCALSEVSESFRTLIEAVEDLTSMKPGRERTLANKETRLLAKSFERSLDSLENEHGYLFSEVEGVEG